MANMSDYLESALRGHIFRGVSFSAPTNLYFSLHTATLVDAGTGTEVSGNGYARVQVACSTGNFSVGTATDGVVSNTNAITFPAATANWGTITHVGIWDASSGGNLLFWIALGSSQAVNSGQTASFAAGQLSVTFQ